MRLWIDFSNNGHAIQKLFDAHPKEDVNGELAADHNTRLALRRQQNESVGKYHLLTVRANVPVMNPHTPSFGSPGLCLITEA